MKRLIVTLVILLSFTVSAHADLNLIGQGTSAWGTYNLIYDTDRDITWYDRAWGGMGSTWEDAVWFADNLTVDFNGSIYNGWRLPTALNQDDSGPCTGFDCTGSELGHLYYTELANSAGAFTNTGDFTALSGRRFWTGTEDTPGASAWEFSFFDGEQYTDDQWIGEPRWIFVYDGLAGAPPVVPEPISSTLFIIGGAIMGFRRFRKKFNK